jgi:hypothetical protein
MTDQKRADSTLEDELLQELIDAIVNMQEAKE